MSFEKYYSLVLILVLIAGSGCEYQSDQQEGSVPDHLTNIENLTDYSSSTQSPDTVELIRETVFESNDEVFIEGYINRLAVDYENRVFISATRPGSAGIYVFNPDGSFLTRFAQHGRGPGEFESISSLNITDNKLYVFDARLQKITIFSLEDFTVLREKLLIRDKINHSKDFNELITGRELFVNEDGAKFMRFESRLIDATDRSILFYKLAGDGTILPGKIMELPGYRIYHPEMRETVNGIMMPFTMPFTRSSLYSMSEDGTFFTAWTEHFLISMHDKEGNYKRSFYYPHEKVGFSLSEFEMTDIMRRELESDTVPDSWPALHTIELDDENQLWVATITESDSTFQWWVLNKHGELSAGFSFLGKRTLRSVEMKPLIMIKNGYFYTHERDFREGIDRIVKYKINLRQR